MACLSFLTNVLVFCFLFINILRTVFVLRAKKFWIIIKYFEVKLIVNFLLVRMEDNKVRLFNV